MSEQKKYDAIMVRVQAEKQRLQLICNLQEDKLLGHAQSLRNNFFSMTLKSVLPFEAETTDTLMNVISMVNKIVLPVLGFPLGEGSVRKERLIRLFQTTAILMAFKIGKKFFSKTKKTSVSKAE